MRTKKRRALPLGCVLLTILAVAPPVIAQTPRIGLLAWSQCEEPQFLRGLEEAGYRPGETITIECRTAGGRYEGFAPAAAELVALGVDVIVGLSQPAGMAAQDATDTIPIVSIVSGDPVAVGLARSLAEPGGNVTGLSYYASELTLKRLELLKELLPEVTRVDVLANPIVSYLPFEKDAARAAGRVGLMLRTHHAGEAADLEGAFEAMVADGAEAVFVLPDMVFATEAARIAALGLQHGLPTIAWGDWFTSAGCLMAYSAEYGRLIHRLAFYVDRILEGARPDGLPIEQPTTFELSINLQTAEALGIAIPPALLLRADEVIE